MSNESAIKELERIGEALATVGMMLIQLQQEFHGLKSKMAGVSTSALNRKSEIDKAVAKALANRQKQRAKKALKAVA